MNITELLKLAKKFVALATSYFGWYEMRMSHFIHSTVTVHLLWVHLSDKEIKRKANAGYMQIMQPLSQNVALGTNLGAIIKTSVKLYLGGFREIRPVLIYLNISNFKTDL